LTVLVGLTEIASVTGVAGSATVANWRTRLSGFPAARSGGKFDLVEVVEWMRDHGPRRTDVRNISAIHVWPLFAAAYQDASGRRPAESRATMVALVLLRHAVERMRVRTDGGLDWQGVVQSVLVPNHADAPLWVPFADQLRLLAADLEAADARLRGLLVQQLTVQGTDARHLMDLVDLLDRIELAKGGRALEAVLQLDPERSLSMRSSGRRLSALVVALGRVQPGHTLLDPAAGEGTILSRAWRDVDGEVRLAGQEVDHSVWVTARSRLLVEDVAADLGERSADSLRDDLHAGSRADVVVVDPPLGDGAPALDRWVEYALGHLAPGGRVVMVLPLHEFVPVSTVRRRPQDRMRKMLQRLLADDLVEHAVVVPSRLRSDIPGPSMLLVLRQGSGPLVHVGGSEADGRSLWSGRMLDELAREIRLHGLESPEVSELGLTVASVPAHRVFQALEEFASVKPRSSKQIAEHAPLRSSVLERLDAIAIEPDDIRSSLGAPSYSAPGWEAVSLNSRRQASSRAMLRAERAGRAEAAGRPAASRSPLEELSSRLSELSSEAQQQRRELTELRDRHALLRAAVRELLQQLQRHGAAIEPSAMRELRFDIDRVERELG
jgi:hypothetical protein